MKKILAGLLIDDCSHVHVSRLVITGNGLSLDNWNCGYRERKVHNAFQEGKTLWTSGFVGT